MIRKFYNCLDMYVEFKNEQEQKEFEDGLKKQYGRNVYGVRFDIEFFGGIDKYPKTKEEWEKAIKEIKKHVLWKIKVMRILETQVESRTSVIWTSDSYKSYTAAKKAWKECEAKDCATRYDLVAYYDGIRVMSMDDDGLRSKKDRESWINFKLYMLQKRMEN